MAGSGEEAARDGLNILLEMASECRALSRTALQERCGLSRRRLDEALTSLGRSGLVARRNGPRGRYHLATPPEETSIGQVHHGLTGRRNQRRDPPPSDSAAGALTALTALNVNATLAELTGVIDGADATVCPYFDACLVLGCPEDSVFRQACHRQPHLSGMNTP